MQGDVIRTTDVNGSRAGIDDFELLAFGNYGHYTSMQIRDHRTRGLQLHLERLEANSQKMFVQPVARRRVMEALRRAVPARGSFSVRVTVFSRDLPAVLMGTPVEPDVMVSIGPGAAPALEAMRVRPVRYQRETPDIKHLATYGLLRELRSARLDGFDDALFVDEEGRVLEGSTWNVVFHDGGDWVWPQGPALNGIAKQLLQTAMHEAGWSYTTKDVRLGDLENFTSAFATNSVTAARRITSIGDRSLSSAAQAATIQELASSIPWDPFEDVA